MILLIHDDKRPEKRDHFEQQLQGCLYSVVEPIPAKTVVKSINLTHKSCVRYAKEHQLPFVTIMEDDVFFPEEAGLMRFLSATPDEYNLYAAGSYHLQRETFDGMYLHQSHVVGLHCYRIAENFYDDFLALPDNIHIDTALEKTGKDIHVLYPIVALQQSGWSSNNQANVDYNIHLEPKDIWSLNKNIEHAHHKI